MTAGQADRIIERGERVKVIDRTSYWYPNGAERVVFVGRDDRYLWNAAGEDYVFADLDVLS